MLVLLVAASARATTEKRAESPVVGVSVAVALGPVPAGKGRVGAGIDAGYQFQWYTEVGQPVDGEFTAWADEHPAPSYGPVVHVWRLAGDWSTAIGGRFGATWPARMGLMDGWIPGPGVTGELGILVSTSGATGIEGEAVLDASYAQLRLATALTPEGLETGRLHVGVLAPTRPPRLWPDGRVAWHEPARSLSPPR